MDPDQNALSILPKPVKFQLMVVLSLMWSAIFCANAGFLVWLPGYVLVHLVLILFGLFGTGWLFHVARANAPVPEAVRRQAKDTAAKRES